LAGRTPQEAVRNFLEPLKAVVGCITDEGLVARQTRCADERQTAAFRAGFAILHRKDGQTLTLELYHRYVVREAQGRRGPWSVSTVEWIYQVGDQSDEPIAEFHWHPESGHIRWPHVHAHGARDSLTLHRLHLPTGRVSVEAVIRFLIEDLGVIPRRSDWEAVLERHEQACRRARSWS
jgi:hypothetical protein